MRWERIEKAGFRGWGGGPAEFRSVGSLLFRDQGLWGVAWACHVQETGSKGLLGYRRLDQDLGLEVLGM